MSTWTAPSPAPAPGVTTAFAVFIDRSVRQNLRNGEALIMAVALPIMLMLLFTWVFGGAIDPGGDYVNYVVPGIVILTAGFGASYTAVAVNQDMTKGIIDRFRTMPLPATALLVGHIVASMAKNLLATAIVVGVGFAVGFRPEANALGWLAAIGLVAAWILAITALFAAIGLAAGSPDAASGYGFALLFLPYLSSAFVQISTLPEWLRPVAEYQPVTPLVDAARALLSGGDPGSAWFVALLWCAGLTAAAVAWGGWLFRRKAGRR